MTRYPLGFAVTLAAGLALAGAARASSCELPDPPGCATDYGRFDDRGDFDDCRRQMGRYSASVRAHIACVRDEYDTTALRFDQRVRR